MRDNGSRNMYGLTQLTSDVAAQMNGVTERQVRDVLSTAFETIMRKVERGDRVSISNFGSWWPAMRRARKGTDIRSGQQIEIGERRVVNFRPGSGFKTRMRNGSSSMSSSSGSQSSRVVGGGGGSR